MRLKDSNGGEQMAMHVFALAIKHVKVSGIMDSKIHSLNFKLKFSAIVIS